MAFQPKEIKRLTDLAEEMVKLIEDRDSSNEAVVAFGRIGTVCTKAISADAAAAAKRTTRTTNITKFQTARQARANNKKGGGTSNSRQGAQQTATK